MYFIYRDGSGIRGGLSFVVPFAFTAWLLFQSCGMYIRTSLEATYVAAYEAAYDSGGG